MERLQQKALKGTSEGHEGTSLDLPVKGGPSDAFLVPARAIGRASRRKSEGVPNPFPRCRWSKAWGKLPGNAWGCVGLRLWPWGSDFAPFPDLLPSQPEAGRDRHSLAAGTCQEAVQDFLSGALQGKRRVPVACGRALGKTPCGKGKTALELFLLTIYPCPGIGRASTAQEAPRNGFLDKIREGSDHEQTACSQCDEAAGPEVATFRTAFRDRSGFG